MNEVIKKLDFNDYHPEDFMELYVCALMIMAEEVDVDIEDAHDGVEHLREQLEFELDPVPPQKEFH